MHTTNPKYSIITLFLAFVISIFQAYAEKRTFTLVIDAGHGGHDAGAVGSYSKEKTINLNVALAFGRLVADNCPDVKIIYTRTTDVFIPLQRRADIANNNKADLFISIHTNALPNGRIAYGSETYSLGMARASANLDVAKRENSVITLESDYKRTYEGFDPNKAESYVIFEIMQDRYMKQSIDLAKCIQSQYRSAGRPDKGVHQAGFLVLRNTTMPSVLTELGFISTPAEEQYLNSKQGIAELSRSIYNGFLTYRRNHDMAGSDIPQNIVTKQPSTAGNQVSLETNAVSNEVEVVPVTAVATADIPRNNKADSIAKSFGSPHQNVEKSATPNDSKSQREKKKPTLSESKTKPAKEEKTPSTSKNKITSTKDRTSGANDKTSASKNNSSVTKSSDKKNTGNTSKSNIEYRIQVGAGKKEISPKDPQFKGLTINRVKEGTLYKYFYGSYATYAEVQKELKAATAKLPGSYIVAYIGGKSVPVSEARATEKNKRTKK